jgi:hypothetical protein
MRNLFALLGLLALPPCLLADMSVPGYPRVPIHFVFEIAEAYPEYQFWLVMRDGPIRMDITPGKPFHATGSTGFRFVRVVAVPATAAQRIGKAELMKLLDKKWEGMPFPASSSQNDFEILPFYDSRRELISHYRISLDPGQAVKLQFLGSEPEPWWSKAIRYVVGISLAIGFTWGGLLTIRRMHKRWTKLPGEPETDVPA